MQIKARAMEEMGDRVVRAEVKLSRPTPKGPKIIPVAKYRVIFGMERRVENFPAWKEAMHTSAKRRYVVKEFSAVLLLPVPDVISKKKREDLS